MEIVRKKKLGFEMCDITLFSIVVEWSIEKLGKLCVMEDLERIFNLNQFKKKIIKKTSQKQLKICKIRNFVVGFEL